MLSAESYTLLHYTIHTHLKSTALATHLSQTAFAKPYRLLVKMTSKFVTRVGTETGPQVVELDGLVSIFFSVLRFSRF